MESTLVAGKTYTCKLQDTTEVRAREGLRKPAGGVGARGGIREGKDNSMMTQNKSAKRQYKFAYEDKVQRHSK